GVLWPDLEGRRQKRAHRAVSGCACHSDAPGERLETQELGPEACEACRHGEGQGGGRTQACSDHASDAGRRNSVRPPTVQAGCSGMSPIAPPRQRGTVLVAVKAATRRLRRWPSALLYPDLPRRPAPFSGRAAETPPRPTNNLTLFSSS